MPKICYVPKDFSRAHRLIVERANEIVAEYAALGFSLTLRQLYYQFVARDLLANQQKEYKRLGDIINDARLAGLIDWKAIEDRTRFLREQSAWTSPAEIVETCAEQFHMSRWADQDLAVEVWIEKDALVGVIEPVCKQFDVPFFSCRGYTSQSEMWVAARRFLRRIEERRYLGAEPQGTLVLHFGDHDPSGRDMSRDIEERIRLFMRRDHQYFQFQRIALNMDQIERYTPPPNPTKLTDSRAQGYIAEYGDESWELDALEPRVIAALIQAEVDAVRDQSRWDVVDTAEQEARRALGKIAGRFDDVTDYLEED